ncbi:MAG: ATPase, T2SS/T4P/T4SS family, partial [Verrucomicrobiia bacterium]
MVDLAENSNNSNDSDGFESAAVKAVAELVGRAERAGASDVHLQMCGQEAQVAFRLDGLITPTDGFPVAVAGRVFGRIKYLARLKTYQDSLPQDGRIAKEDIDAAHDVRVAT